jgi:hypothetical protein
MSKTNSDDDDDDDIPDNVEPLFADKKKDEQPGTRSSAQTEEKATTSNNKRDAPDTISMMNKVHSTVMINGKFWIQNERDDEVTYSTEKDFIADYRPYKTKFSTMQDMFVLKDEYQPASKVWLESPKRRSYRGIKFDPSGLISEKYYNTWKGFAVAPKQGDCSKTLEFIRNVISSGDEKVFQWNMSYWAHMFQRPWQKPEVAFVMIGDKGVGKSFFMSIIKKLVDGNALNRHFFVTANPGDEQAHSRE